MDLMILATAAVDRLKRPYVCSWCRSVSRSNVHKHMRKCKGGLRYECAYCSFCSRNRCTMASHMRVHVAKTI